MISRVELVNLLYTDFEKVGEAERKIAKSLRKTLLRIDEEEFIELYPLTLHRIRKNRYYIV